MKEIIQHPTYGEIVYDENFWTGKKALTVNGVDAKPISKKEFMIDGKKATIKGNFFAGINVCIDNETVELSPKPKWYEIVLAVLPLVFLLTWGNSPSLCSIFPVIGGAIGGALGGLSSVTSLLFMKKSKSPIAKVLIGIGAFVATIMIAFVLAVAFVLILS